MSAVGLLEAVASAVANGSFGVFSKAKSVQANKVPSPIFNFWVSVGIILSSLPLLAVTPQVFTPWGLLSGVLFVLSTSNTFLAINRVGLSAASGIWSGVAVLVSFTFGVRFAGDEISRPGLAAPGLMLLVAGLSGIAFVGQAASSSGGSERDDNGELIPPSLPRSTDDAESAAESPQRSSGGGHNAIGILAAIAAGFFGGLVLAPMTYAPPEARGVQYVPSMALGVLISAPVITAAIVALSKDIPWLLYAPQAALPGIFAGLVWNVGNVFSILATESPIGLAIAYPIMQSGLFVAGLWGIFLFRELRGRERVFYFISGAVLLAGASMLASSK